MKLFYSIAACLVIMGGFMLSKCNNASTTPHEKKFTDGINYTLKINGPIAANQPMFLRLIMRNDSDHKIAVRQSNAIDGLGIRVLDSNRQLVPLTALGMSELGDYNAKYNAISSPSFLSASIQYIQVISGESKSYAIDLTKYFELKSGQYHVIADANLVDEVSKNFFILRAKEITLTVP